MLSLQRIFLAFGLTAVIFFVRTTSVRAVTLLEAVSSSPYSEEINVSVTATPYVVFSSALNSSTIISKNIQLRHYDDNLIVTTTFSLADNDSKVIFTPVEYLINSTTYYFFIGTGVKDVYGNKLANTWYAADKKKHSFTTAPSSTQELVIDESVDETVQNNTSSTNDNLKNNSVEEKSETINTSTQNIEENLENQKAQTGGGGAPISSLPYIININTEAVDLKSKSALLKMEVNNNPAQMMISLSPQLSDTVWVPYSENILWNFGKQVSGATTVYARLKNNSGEGMVFNYIFSLGK